MMGQASIRLAKWSTSGGLRWEKEEYKREKIPLHEGSSEKEWIKNKEMTEYNEGLNICKNLKYIHKNILSLDLTSVFLFKLYFSIIVIPNQLIVITFDSFSLHLLNSLS